MIIVEEYIALPLTERQKHLDLEQPCIERGGNSTVHRGVLAQYLNTNFPKKVDLCHACNNDNCSNPQHLYWGTRKENVQDAINAGTFVNAYQSCVKKYGLEWVKEKNKSNGKTFGSIGGKGNKNKPKSEEHRRKISESVKKHFAPVT